MNPYSDVTLPRPADPPYPALDDVAAPAPLPAPPLHAVLDLSDQSEPPLHTGQSELYNPYAEVCLPSGSAHNVNDHHHFLSADHTDKSDVWNPGGLSTVTAQVEAEEKPDLECFICFSQFNNAFRCPKRLQCGHTFCLECLARMNVKSPEPSAVQCPLCRAQTPLPALGLPKLSTDPEVLSHLPSSMQRVYSIRFLRNKGRLQLKRPDTAILTHSTRRSLDVGMPSPVPRDGAGGGHRGRVGGALFSCTNRPAPRAILLAAVIMVIIFLTGIIVLLLVVNESQS